MMLAKDFQQPRKQRRPAAKQDQTDNIQRPGCLTAIIRHVAIGQQQRHDAYRHVDKKDLPP